MRKHAAEGLGVGGFRVRACFLSFVLSLTHSEVFVLLCGDVSVCCGCLSLHRVGKTSLWERLVPFFVCDFFSLFCFSSHAHCCVCIHVFLCLCVCMSLLATVFHMMMCLWCRACWCLVHRRKCGCMYVCMCVVAQCLCHSLLSCGRSFCPNVYQSFLCLCMSLRKSVFFL